MNYTTPRVILQTVYHFSHFKNCLYRYLIDCITIQLDLVSYYINPNETSDLENRRN